jgi:hypothetical protein
MPRWYARFSFGMYDMLPVQNVAFLIVIQISSV